MQTNNISKVQQYLRLLFPLSIRHFSSITTLL